MITLQLCLEIFGVVPKGLKSYCQLLSMATTNIVPTSLETAYS